MANTLEAIEAAHQSDEFDYDIEFRFRCADGSYTSIRSTGTVIERGPNGEALRMIGQHTDISALVAAREEAMAARRTAETAVNEIQALRTAMDKHMLCRSLIAAGASSK